MIKFEHNGFKYFVGDHAKKGMMVQKWNFEVELDELIKRKKTHMSWGQ